jgi:hypothetical protein
MRLLIITSCTGQKTVKHEDGLTCDDFVQGAKHLAKRERELKVQLTPAASLYSGQQHVRLMKGIKATEGKLDIDLHIVSAGYGLVDADRPLAPYECTFTGRGKADLADWAGKLNIPEDFRTLVGQSYDLALLLLGDDYLAACRLDDQIKLGSPTLIFCGGNTSKNLPKLDRLVPVTLTNAEAKRFSCGLVGLKGELAARLLARLASDKAMVKKLVNPTTNILNLLDTNGSETSPQKTVRQKARANPQVDQVIQLPDSWRRKTRGSKLRYFIPEWDDLVDPDYDFDTDTHSGGSGDWSNEVYAHQMYPEPNYDGILISKVVAEKSKKKKERINAMGVHRFLRVPRDFPIMGDCGAFGYIAEKNPPYATDEILDYYTRLDFDYGVSIDHLIVSSNESEWKHRYQLTIDNAADFIREHHSQGLDWTPIGAVQGWDPKSYADAAAKIVKMGYKYLALGGLVRSPSPEIIKILQRVRDQVPAEIDIHLFGLARLGALPIFQQLGVSSVDSASFLRRAWMGTGQNYLTDRGEFVAAIRIPEAEKSFRAKRMVSEGRASLVQVKRMEKACFKAMHDFDAGKISVKAACDVLEEYDQLITPDRKSTRPLLENALEDAPWKRCQCDICRKDGIQVIIFRGNNRNRRRGFHNTWLFYRMFNDILAGKDVPVPGRKDLQSLLAEVSQQSLFDHEVAV